MAIHPVILCGGKGTRLWPLSRRSMPKQFIPLWSDHTCFQETVLRVRGRGFSEPLIVTGHDYRFIVSQQLQEIGVSATILLEPEGRNSGPALLAAANWLKKRYPDSVMAVIAADHRISDTAAFQEAIVASENIARDGRIVVFGVKPNNPATGYGYIKPGSKLEGSTFSIDGFVEKPNADTAACYIERGYLWNSGNFVLTPDVAIAEYAASNPETVKAVTNAVARATMDLDFIVLDRDAYVQSEAKSFDYAVMEQTSVAAVRLVDFSWSDVGTWQALWESGEKSQAGNVSRGRVTTIDAQDCIVDSHKDRITALLGVKDLVVVNSQDAVLVADRSRAGDVGVLVDKLIAHGVEQATNHKQVHRPWGWYETLDLAERFQVKRIVVYPGGRLSLQKHMHRSEHWVVVRGSAVVTIGETEKVLHENESVYVPVGSLHRLENQGKIDLELIEVQTGSYLGEDDIIRLDDVYGRKPDT